MYPDFMHSLKVNIGQNAVVGVGNPSTFNWGEDTAGADIIFS